MKFKEYAKKYIDKTIINVVKIYDKIVWNRFIEDMIRFKSNNGHCNIPSTHKLYKKCALVRKSYHNKTLSIEKINKLKDLGFRFNINSQNNDNWKFMFDKLKNLVKEDKNLSLDSIQEDKKLSNWINTQKKAYKKDNLPKCKYRKLSALGIDLNK